MPELPGITDTQKALGVAGGVQIAYDASGTPLGVQGLSKRALQVGSPNLSAYPSTTQHPAWKRLQPGRPWSAPLVPAGTALINEAVSAGSSGNVVSVDTSVTFAGMPTTKFVLNGTPSGAAGSLGTTAATFTLNAAAKDILSQFMTVAFKASFSINQVQIYVGDATYANFYNIVSASKVTTPDGWQVFTIDTTEPGIVSITGTPDLVGAKRVKVQFTAGAVLAGGGNTVWLGYAGASMRPKPRVVLTFDDGYAEWSSFLVPELKKRGLPGTFGIDAAYVNTSGFMTTAQLAAIQSDASGLFELINHGANDQSYVGVGLTQYLANLDACDALLASIGVPAASRKLHPYVQGSFDQTLVDAMKAKGFYSMREVGAQDRSVYPLLAGINASSTDAQNYFDIPAGVNLTAATSVATAIGYIENAKIRGRTIFVMGHKLQAAAALYTWVAGYDATNGILNFLDYLAAERDAGRLDVLRWSDYMALEGAGLPI